MGVVFYFQNRTKLQRGRTSRFEVEVQFVQQGTGKWAHYTGATLKFRRPEQRPRPFCWTLLAGCGKTYLFMKSLSAPCDKTGFL